MPMRSNTYIRAKDENRPHLMPNVFTPDARLEMRVETGNISFPPASKRIEAWLGRGPQRGSIEARHQGSVQRGRN
jgi:hypothetical protein